MNNFIEVKTKNGVVAILASKIVWIAELRRDFPGNEKAFIATSPRNKEFENGWFVLNSYNEVMTKLSKALGEKSKEKDNDLLEKIEEVVCAVIDVEETISRKGNYPC